MRYYSQVLRKIFNVPLTGPFPVLRVLGKLGEVFKNCNYEIVDDKKLSPQTMARCTPNAQNGFTIEIKESVYVGAYEKQIGTFLGFICHFLNYCSSHN